LIEKLLENIEDSSDPDISEKVASEYDEHEYDKTPSAKN
jgi:hypothetical protein